MNLNVPISLRPYLCLNLYLAELFNEICNIKKWRIDITKWMKCPSWLIIISEFLCIKTEKCFFKCCTSLPENLANLVESSLTDRERYPSDADKSEPEITNWTETEYENQRVFLFPSDFIHKPETNISRQNTVVESLLLWIPAKFHFFPQKVQQNTHVVEWNDIIHDTSVHGSRISNEKWHFNDFFGWLTI